jgi:hypothetical protein
MPSALPPDGLRMAPRYRCGVDFTRAPTELSQRFCHDHSVCASARRGNLQISNGLSEFVLQICLLRLSPRPSLYAGCKSASVSAASGRAHRALREVVHCARQFPMRNGRGRAWCAVPRSKKVARQRGKGIPDSLSSGSGNLDVQLRRQRLPFADPQGALEPVHDPIDLMAQVRIVSILSGLLQNFSTSRNSTSAVEPNFPRSIFGIFSQPTNFFRCLVGIF